MAMVPGTPARPSLPNTATNSTLTSSGTPSTAATLLAAALPTGLMLGYLAFPSIDHWMNRLVEALILKAETAKQKQVHENEDEEGERVEEIEESERALMIEDEKDKDKDKRIALHRSLVRTATVLEDILNRTKAHLTPKANAAKENARDFDAEKMALKKKRQEIFAEYMKLAAKMRDLEDEERTGITRNTESTIGEPTNQADAGDLDTIISSNDDNAVDDMLAIEEPVGEKSADAERFKSAAITEISVRTDTEASASTADDDATVVDDTNNDNLTVVPVEKGERTGSMEEAVDGSADSTPAGRDDVEAKQE